MTKPDENTNYHAMLIKLQNWCAYQERSPKDCLLKSRELGATKDEANSLLSDLISNNFVNEERFAQLFTQGKFRIKKWGKLKIKLELKKKNISNYSINKAISLINEGDYIKTIEQLMSKKVNGNILSEKPQDKFKLIRYLNSKGFELEIINDVLNNKHD